MADLFEEWGGPASGGAGRRRRAAAPGGFWSRFAAGVAAAMKGTRNG